MFRKILSPYKYCNKIPQFYTIKQPYKKIWLFFRLTKKSRTKSGDVSLWGL